MIAMDIRHEATAQSIEGAQKRRFLAVAAIHRAITEANAAAKRLWKALKGTTKAGRGIFTTLSYCAFIKQ